MLNQLTIRERPNKKDIESLDLARKVNFFITGLTIVELWEESKFVGENFYFLNSNKDRVKILFFI